MISFLSPQEVIEKLFNHMVEGYDRDTYPAIDVVYQFFFSVEGEVLPYFIEVKEGEAAAKKGKHPKPTVTISTPLRVWLDIANGSLNPIWGLITRRYTLKGGIRYLRLMPKLFRVEREISELTHILEGEADEGKTAWRKPARILLLQGAPRAQEGFTEFYIDPFLKGISSTGAVVEKVYLAKQKIKPCRGCFSCWTDTPGKCIQRDDMEELLKRLEEADLIIYAFPLYADSTPGILKNVLERQIPRVYPYMKPYKNLTRHPRRHLKRQYIFIFAICGFPEKRHFDPVLEMFRAHARNLHAPLIGAILRPGAMAFYFYPTQYFNLVHVHDALKEAGRQLVERGRVNKKLLRTISRTYGQKAIWQKNANIFWYNEQRKDQRS